MNMAQQAELELDNLRRKMLSCMSDLDKFLKRVQVVKASFNEKKQELKDIRDLANGERIVGIVAKAFNVDPYKLSRKYRRDDALVARQVAHYILRHSTDLSLNEIAGLTGLRDHTSVLYSEKQVEKRRQEKPDFDVAIRKLLSKAIGDDQEPDVQ